MVYVSNHVEMHAAIRFVLFLHFALFWIFPPSTVRPPPQDVLDENMEQNIIQDNAIDKSSRNSKSAVRHFH